MFGRFEENVEFHSWNGFDGGCRSSITCNFRQKMRVSRIETVDQSRLVHRDVLNSWNFYSINRMLEFKLDIPNQNRCRSLLYQGALGTGKTSCALRFYAGLYEPCLEDQNIYFDGYADEEVLFIDDFCGEGDLSFSRFLRLINCPHGMPFQDRFRSIEDDVVYPHPTLILFASEHPLGNWYPDHHALYLNRYVKHVIFFPLGDIFMNPDSSSEEGESPQSLLPFRSDNPMPSPSQVACDLNASLSHDDFIQLADGLKRNAYITKCADPVSLLDTSYSSSDVAEEEDDAE